MKNKADIKRDTLNDHPSKERSAFNLKLAGINLAPWEFEHEGSFAVHFYRKNGETTFAFICQTSGLGAIPEAQTDVGLKELRRALMGFYGREEKRRPGADEILS